MNIQLQRRPPIFSSLNIPVYLFLFFATVFGTVCLFRPPLQTLNGWIHVYRGFALSHGIYAPILKDQTLGLEVNAGVKDFVQSYERAFAEGQSLDSKKFFFELREKPTKRPKDELVFIPLDRSDISSPVRYIPFALGARVVRLIGGSVLQQYIIGSAFNLLTYVFLSALAIMVIPSGKYVFALLALVPVAVSEASTPSPGAISAASVLLFIGYILRHRENEELMNPAEIFNILTLTMILVIMEPLYLSMVILLLLLPSSALGRGLIRIYGVWLIGLVAVCSISMFVYLSVDRSNTGAGPYDNLYSLVSEPGSAVSLVWSYLRSGFLADASASVTSFHFYIGSAFGYSFPQRFSIIYFLGLIILAYLSKPMRRFSIGEIVVLLLGIGLYLGAVLIYEYSFLVDGDKTSVIRLHGVRLIPLYIIISVLITSVGQVSMRWGAQASALVFLALQASLGVYYLRMIDSLWKNPAAAKQVEGELEQPLDSHKRPEAGRQ